jgi:hypothetical protein
MLPMRSKRRVNWLLSAALLVATQVAAKVEPLALSELVAQADAIVIARVQGSKATALRDVVGGTKHQASLSVEETLKGRVRPTLSVDYFPAASASPTFTTGERVVVFLKGSEKGFVALRKMPISGGKVSVSGVLDASATQNLTAFLNEVRALLRNK